jgi:DNA-binding transcriptional LysR family regulator
MARPHPDYPDFPDSPAIRTAPLEWTALRDFLAVAESGSLSAAARRLGVSQPTLTRRMAALEERLGAELFLRTPRGLELTEAGEAILEPARHMEQEARAAEVAVTGRDRALAGAVRITATEGLAIDWLTPELASFQRSHPEIEIQFLIRNTNVNLLEREADIAVRLGRPRQADLVARRVGTLGYGLYASPAYLDARGRPRNDEDLRSHQAVVFDELLRHSQFGTWLERSLGPARIVYRANSIQAQLAAMRAGYGIGAQAPFITSRRGELERVLPERELHMEIWLVTHPGLRRSARMRAVYDFLLERFESERDALAGAVPAEPSR